MKYLLVGLLCAFVLVGCSEGEAQTEPTPTVEPWIVTGTSWVRDGDQESVLVVQYTSPIGPAEWRRGLPESNSVTENWIRCWYSVEIGAPLPDCVRKDNLPE